VWSTADGVNWQQHANGPWHPRQYHDVAAWDGKLWVLEGYHQDGGNRKDVWYSSDGESWAELPDTPWLPRHAAGVCAHGDALWVVGGNNMTPDAWRLVRA
jgi:N-acetylneuraminic acid mutarotase